MSDQLRSSESQRIASSSERQQNGYETIGRGTAWAYYALVGFWLRLSVFFLFFVAGAALVAAFPVAVLEQIGIIRWHIINIAGITYESGVLYLFAAAVLSIFGVLWFAAGYSMRRWLRWHP